MGPLLEMSADKVKETIDNAVVYDNDDVKKLCNDYAAYTRVNLAEDHGQIVTSIAGFEEQLHTFTEMLELINNDNTTTLTRTLPTISAQFEALKPSFQQIDKLEGLVDRIGQDMDVMEKQLDEAENTIVEGTLKNVLRMPLNLFNKQLTEGNGAGREEFVPHNIFRTTQY